MKNRKTMRKLLSLKIFAIVLALTSSNKFAYAVVDCTLSDPPTPAQIICPFIRMFNFALIAGGAVFLIFIVIGAIKMATALGDPKGLKSSRDTWIFAVLGVFVVLGVLTIFRIINNVFGLGLGNYFILGGENYLFTRISDVMNDLFENVFKIYEDPNYN